MVTMQRLDLQNSQFSFSFADATPGDKAFFIAPFDLTIKAIDYVHATAGSDGGAVTLNLERLQGTEAPGGNGDALLATAFNCKGTANTVQNGALTATTASLTLSKGNRLGLDYTGTLTALAGVVVSVLYEKA
jgi:hypothetical protein